MKRMLGRGCCACSNAGEAASDFNKSLRVIFMVVHESSYTNLRKRWLLGFQHIMERVDGDLGWLLGQHDFHSANRPIARDASTPGQPPLAINFGIDRDRHAEPFAYSGLCQLSYKQRPCFRGV